MLKRPGSACEDAMGGEKLPGESMFNLRKSPYFLSFASSRRARRRKTWHFHLNVIKCEQYCSIHCHIYQNVVISVIIQIQLEVIIISVQTCPLCIQFLVTKASWNRNPLGLSLLRCFYKVIHNF